MRSGAAKARRQARLRKYTLESLEPRTLMAVIPPALISSAVNISPGVAQAGGSGQHEFTPSIAVNPNNPLQVVSVWSRVGPAPTLGGPDARPTRQTMDGAFSLNGGANWGNFTAQRGFFNDVSTQNPTLPLIVSSDAAVAFDRDNNFYVVESQTGADFTVGVIVVSKYAFGVGGPSFVSRSVLYEWGGTNGSPEQALLPTIAVDSGATNFVDPVTGATQRDKYSGNVYVAWTAFNPSIPPDAGGPTHRIKIVGSSDGGQSFTAPVTVSDSPYGNTSARLVVQQGGVTGSPSASRAGRVAVVWDNYINGSTRQVPVDLILSDSLSAVVYQRNAVTLGAFSGAITDATAPNPADAPHGPVTSRFTLNVDLASNTKFDLIADLNVELSLINPDNATLRIRLIPPAGSGLNPITLLDNRTRADGAAKATGAAGTNLGTPSALGSIPGVIFDAQANQSINAVTAASTGYYRPDSPAPAPPDEGAAGAFSTLGSVNGLTPAQLSGIWTLEITDFRYSGSPTAPPPPQYVNAWGLQFSSGFVPAGLDREVASTTLRGSLTPPVGLVVSPSPVIAADNTLGSQSPRQGRLYVAYVDRFNAARDGNAAAANPADNTDIRLAYSDDGGVNWTLASTKVNDDSSYADGTSASVVSNNAITGRPQFQPEVAVDQATGTLVVSFLDTRNDASRSRVATYVTASVDGGATFNTQVFVNTAQTATDVITGATVVLGPIPDNPVVDGARAFGHRQGLAVLNGRVYPAYASNENGGNDGSNTMDIRVAPGTIAAGPRVVTGTMGPVAGTSFQSFTVTFDRPIRAATFTAADVSMTFLPADPAVGGPGGPVGIANVTAVNATTFLITLSSAQTGVGTYTYTVGPNVQDLLGNTMDQNGDAVLTLGQAGNRYALAGLIGGDPTALPIMISGPRVIDVQTPNFANALVLNAAANALDVTFDRPMDANTFTPADIVSLTGPAGPIVGPFTVTPLDATGPVPPGSPLPATRFRIGFPNQVYSGSYSLVLGPNILSVTGYAMDANRNAGLLAQRGSPDAAGTTRELEFATAAATAIPAATSPTTPATVYSSPITVADDFDIQDLDVRLNILFGDDPSLTVTLLAFDPAFPTDPTRATRVILFGGAVPVGATNDRSNFLDTRFDDSATTPIANGEPPFRGRFRPQARLEVLNGQRSARTFQLEITNASTGVAGSLNDWAILVTRPVPGTGLGESVADRTTAGFRVFTLLETNAQATSSWTPVGPAAIALGSSDGPVGAVAVDPSDPSGNTVYVGGSTGGVWKTTNFLTSSAAGPVYQPLTDFGPTSGLNIGGIAIFGRNGDPGQSIIFAGTGEATSYEGDTPTTGVGILRSTDGGATWTLLDSRRNVDGTGAILPVGSNQRDRVFAGSVTYKITVDPRPTVNGKAIVYAALGGLNGGLWRSTDSGDTWTLLRAGTATDVTLAQNSGTVDAISNPTGNLQILTAAFQGEGVFLGQNQGSSSLTLMAGGVGKPLTRNGDVAPSQSIPVDPTPLDTPNGTTKGRIFLASPEALPNATTQNRLYLGWVYAAVATPGGDFDGLYMTKDFGLNWTRVQLPTATTNGVLVPTNDPTPADVNFQVLSLVIDPSDPNVVYIGGNRNGTGLIRVDTTGINDVHAFYLDNDNPDAGALRVNTTDTLSLSNPTGGLGYNYITPTGNPYLNLYQNPANPFVQDSTILVSNTARIGNSGSDSKWIPLDRAVQPDPYIFSPLDPRSVPMNGVQRAVAFRDPLTGLTRLIFGTAHGVATSVVYAQGNQQLLGSIGSTEDPDSNTGDLRLVNGSRNGNLQLAQFYYGAAQPSQSAANAAGSFFYGGSLRNGNPVSNANVINETSGNYGNIAWSGPGRGSGTGVATDQTGSGTMYQYRWPSAGGDQTNFFQVNGVGRTSGLVRTNLPGGIPDPQWPALSPTYAGGHALGNFAVNPVNGREIIISSSEGRIFGTTDEGGLWLIIGEPGAGSVSGSPAQALAFGAPTVNDPTAPTNSLLYVGTNSGQIFVTTSGGGAWTDISAGLDGSAVQAIVTNPTRGSYEAFAVTLNGVYRMRASNVAGATWQNITGDIFQQQHLVLNNPALGTEAQARFLTSLQVDWRYLIPDDFANPGGPTHPLLYVGAQGGVYRSIDNGTNWRLFPDVALNAAPVAGGFLPNAHVTDLDLSLGNVNRTTGRPDVATGENLLMATTYGRGSFAIRLAPLVFPNTGSDRSILRIAAADDTGFSNSDGVTRIADPTIQGLSEQTAFGNRVFIDVYDVTSYTDAQIADVLAGRLPAPPRISLVQDASQSNVTDNAGRFSVKLAPGYFRTDGTTDGLKKLLVQATNGSGTKGNYAFMSFTLDTTRPGQGTTPSTPSTPDLLATSDSGLFQNDNITNIATGLAFSVTLSNDLPLTSPVTANRIFLVRDTDGNVVAQAEVLPGTTVTLVDPSTVTEGTHNYYVYQTDLAGNQGDFSAKLAVRVDLTRPAKPNAPSLDAALPAPGGSDSGDPTDRVTNVNTPYLTGAAEANTRVRIVDSAGNSLSDTSNNLPNVAGNGRYSIPTIVLADGKYALRVRNTDVAGNESDPSDPLNVEIIAQNTPAKPTLTLVRADDSGPNNQDNITNVPRPRLEGLSTPGLNVQLILVSSSTGTFPGGVQPGGVIAPTVGQPPVIVRTDGGYQVQFPNELTDGIYTVKSRVVDRAGNIAESDPLALRILRGTGDSPSSPGAPIIALLPADDSGTKGDNTTVVRRPRIVGTALTKDNKALAGAVVELVTTGGQILATATSNGFGAFTINLPNDLSNGRIDLLARVRDVAGNTGADSAVLPLTITSVDGDADGDAQADLDSYSFVDGQFTFVKSASAASTDRSLGFQAGDIPLQGDFDGDGRMDYGFFRQSTAVWVVQQTRAGLLQVPFGAPGDQPIQADFDGDGRTDLAVWTPSTSTWTISNSRNGSRASVQFGVPGQDQPVPADYDGDGKADFAVFRNATGEWRAFLSSGANSVPNTFGPAPGQGNLAMAAFGVQNQSVPVPADYDGDRKADLGVYVPGGGAWFLAKSAGGQEGIGFGLPNVDIPAPTDYDADGKADVAVFRPNGPAWFVQSSLRPGTVVALGAGKLGDVPLVAPLSYRIPRRATTGPGTSASNFAAAAAPAPGASVGVSAYAAPSATAAPAARADAGTDLGGTAANFAGRAPKAKARKAAARAARARARHLAQVQHRAQARAARQARVADARHLDAALDALDA